MTPWTVAHISDHGIIPARILEWIVFPSRGDLPTPGTEPVSLASPVFTGRVYHGTTWEAHIEDDYPIIMAKV